MRSTTSISTSSSSSRFQAQDRDVGSFIGVELTTSFHGCMMLHLEVQIHTPYIPSPRQTYGIFELNPNAYIPGVQKKSSQKNDEDNKNVLKRKQWSYSNILDLLNFVYGSKRFDVPARALWFP